MTTTPKPMTTSPKRPHRRRARELLAGVAAMIASASFLVLGAAGTAEASAPARPAGKATYEVSFLKEMIMHHHMAVMMAEVCAERTDVRPELRRLCRGIVADQTREIVKMQAWLSEWYGIDYDPMDEMDPAAMEAEMAAMRAMPTAEFEQFFLEEMIAHHRLAIQSAKPCVRKADHGPLRNLCTRIVDAQLSEIRLMRRFLCEWYDSCSSGGGAGSVTPAAAY